MPAQSRRPASRPTRSQRRAGAQTSRTYSVPEAPARPRPATRHFAPEPPPVDHTVEFSWVRKDLVRILIWASLIIATMIVLSFFF